MIMAAFANWLDTYLDEKGIEPEDHLFSCDTPGKFWTTHMVPMPVVVLAAKSVSAAEQLVIKNTLVRLDFLNQDPLPYFRHLAQAIAESWEETPEQA
ncbi:hypothetical protein J4T94_gp063 [Mycobacterium phage Krypton555]|uniref:Uncharacterized protein n=1 Tax=Mycobacterium phage Krypton555 TaxID=2015885 RepID=A0A222ZQY6_9CAUD|nr:hypothetical protein J4T94_gp063 [Mycobacterium phage Krypton555]ASR87153.1 hypothetical protein KRYPTON555_129 [Mycobacterium phage Krypton555]